MPARDGTGPWGGEGRGSGRGRGGCNTIKDFFGDIDAVWKEKK